MIDPPIPPTRTYATLTLPTVPSDDFSMRSLAARRSEMLFSSSDLRQGCCSATTRHHAAVSQAAACDCAALRVSHPEELFASLPTLHHTHTSTHARRHIRAASLHVRRSMWRQQSGPLCLQYAHVDRVAAGQTLGWIHGAHLSAAGRTLSLSPRYRDWL